MSEKIEYRVFDPSIGSYASFDTQEEANTQAQITAWSIFLRMAHDKPISKVIIQEDGTEIWNAE
jgi:hypothetical protein